MKVLKTFIILSLAVGLSSCAAPIKPIEESQSESEIIVIADEIVDSRLLEGQALAESFYEVLTMYSLEDDVLLRDFMEEWGLYSSPVTDWPMLFDNINDPELVNVSNVFNRTFEMLDETGMTNGEIISLNVLLALRGVSASGQSSSVAIINEMLDWSADSIVVPVDAIYTSNDFLKFSITLVNDDYWQVKADSLLKDLSLNAELEEAPVVG